MIFPHRRFALVASLLFHGAAICRAQAPSDIVPRTDIVYDLLGSLAAAGKLKGYTLADFARGDRLYTRAEIATILRRNTPADGKAERFSIAERILRQRFAPELNRMDADRFELNPSVPARGGEAGGWAKVRLESNPDAFSGIGTLFGAAAFGRDGYAVIGLGNQSQEWSSGQKLRYPGTYTDLQNAYVHLNGRVLDLSVGVMPVRWGAGYSGALLIGDDMPPIPQLHVDKSFLLPGTVGRHVGRLDFEEFVGQFFEANDPAAVPDARGTRRFLVGRRFTDQTRGPWGFSLSEALLSTRLPDPEWASILPLYLYQNEWTDHRKTYYLPFLDSNRQADTYWKNYSGAAEATYTLNRRSGAVAYGGLVIDDLRSPKELGGNYASEQKLGEQYGFYLPHPGGSRLFSGFRLEYTTIDPETYTNDSAPVEWNANGAPLGYPSGPNARVLFSRADFHISRRISAALEAETRRDHGVPPPGYAVENANRVSAYGAYALSNNAFTGLRIDSGNGLLDDLSEPIAARRTRVEINAGIGF